MKSLANTKGHALRYARPFFNQWIKSSLILSILLILLNHKVLAAKPAPKFWISNLEGTRYHSKKNARNQIISFFYVDCVPCRKEISDLYLTVTQKLRDVDLLFIDPRKEDSIGRIKWLAQKLNVPEKYFYHDALSSLADKFFPPQKSRVFPTIILIQNHRIIATWHEFSGARKQELITLFGR